MYVLCYNFISLYILVLLYTCRPIWKTTLSWRDLKKCIFCENLKLINLSTPLLAQFSSQLQNTKIIYLIQKKNIIINWKVKSLRFKEKQYSTMTRIFWNPITQISFLMLYFVGTIGTLHQESLESLKAMVKDSFQNLWPLPNILRLII